jgi:hypothetical protein
MLYPLLEKYGRKRRSLKNGKKDELLRYRKKETQQIAITGEELPL